MLFRIICDGTRTRKSMTGNGDSEQWQHSWLKRISACATAKERNSYQYHPGDFNRWIIDGNTLSRCPCIRKAPWKRASCSCHFGPFDHFSLSRPCAIQEEQIAATDWSNPIVLILIPLVECGDKRWEQRDPAIAFKQPEGDKLSLLIRMQIADSQMYLLWTWNETKHHRSEDRYHITWKIRTNQMNIHQP